MVTLWYSVSAEVYRCIISPNLLVLHEQNIVIFKNFRSPPPPFKKIELSNGEFSNFYGLGYIKSPPPPPPQVP